MIIVHVAVVRNINNVVVNKPRKPRKYGSNDLITFRNKDDVLTVLIELRREFARSIREVKRDETIQRVRESDRLIYDTVHGNADAVADQIEKIHAEETAGPCDRDEVESVC